MMFRDPLALVRRASRAAGHATICIALGAGVLAAPAQAQLKSGDNPQANEVWQKVRASLFKARTITDVGNDVLELDAPTRAEDAAIVPIAIRVRAPQTAAGHVKKLYLLIDNNPSPIAAIFSLGPDSGRAEIETRVRIDEYTHVRAIAETSDGRLLMATRFVKASGGCSAPPGKDQSAALASLGKMKIRVEGDAVAKKPLLAQLMISHPNNSGLAMDQLTRQYTPAHFVRSINVSYAGTPVLSADLDISISENPSLRFWFVPRGDGELKAEIVDSKDLQFASSLRLRTLD